jgi:uncharacterized protein (DUF342 family)
MNSNNTTLHSFEQNMRLIDLAYDCVFINASEKEKTIQILEEKSNKSTDIDVIDIFKQEKFISDKRIERLLDLDVHLQIQMQDQQFGRIAVVNGLASREDVENALKYQEKNFNKKQVNLYLGDILVQNQAISNAVRVSILLTQNRIKNENLITALSDMCETQEQKSTIEKRLGVLAVRNNLATVEQVKVAFEIQKKELSLNGKPRFIADILKETADLSDDDILKILLEQKQFEKRKFDLERGLYTVKSEIAVFKKLSKLFEYSISKDGLEAFVKKLKETGEAIPIYEFFIWLRRAGITIGIVDDTLLEEFIQKGEPNSQITVAKGYPAEQCTNESIQFYFKNELITDLPEPVNTKAAKPEQVKQIEKKENEEPLFIEKGQMLAQIISGKKGKPGKKVSGHPIHPEKPSISTLNAGRGVIKKGYAFYAQIDGQPLIEKGTTLIVEPVVEESKIKTISGSIRNDTKNIYNSAIVEINGSITHEAVFRCHSLLLHGHLLGSVSSTGDIKVRGNIGTDKIIEGEETRPWTVVNSHGSIRAYKSIINSEIKTGGELSAFNSSVIGSKVTAYEGMSIKDSLKGKNSPCILQFGLKPDDKILDIDYTIESKNTELLLLKKNAEIVELTETYEKDLKEEEDHQIEQIIINNLIEIIGAPEFFQYEELADKVKYLRNLPMFSSIKAHYLKFPETESALAILNQIIASTESMSHENVVKYLHKIIDPEPEEENAASNTYGIETNFKARLAALQQEIKGNSKKIEKIENEITGLYALRARLVLKETDSMPQSTVMIKNKCEEGTIIKGRIAQLIIEKNLYNVKFKEVMEPGTNTAVITIETY